MERDKIKLAEKVTVQTRIDALFKEKKANVLSVFCTAGFPELDSTLTVLQSLQASGADMVEIGIPYSDPLADGPVIQESSNVAIANGMTLETLFGQLRALRDSIQIPVVLMGYINPVMRYGFEKFFKDAADCGIDGVIIPDMPEDVFKHEVRELARRFGLDFIFLVTPATSEERARRFDCIGSGFIYAVSSHAITGADHRLSHDYLQRVQSWRLMRPVLAGFGIKDSLDFTTVCKYTNGAIIGSAYIKALNGEADIDVVTKRFIQMVRGDR